jgi:hypothetical protein
MLVIVPSDIVESAMRHCTFRTSGETLFAVSGSAIERYGADTILDCLATLQREADLRGGLEHVQVFGDSGHDEALWFIEDTDAGAIVALLSSEY